ncbi:hypothetical protein JCM10207_003224 [Rhodosporidiobolus poonsookiae]
MSAIENYAALLTAPKTPLVVEQVPMWEPEANEVLVKVHAVAFAPLDRKIYDGLIPAKQSFPVTLGTDLSGVIVSVGADVEGFKAGDRIAAFTSAALSGAARRGAFQQYASVPGITTTKIPDDVSFEEGAVLPLAIATASAGLFQPDFLNLSLPSSSSAAPSVRDQPHKTLLVTGGASSVGSAAVQLASAAGLRVIATASPAHFELVRSLGAAVVVDYRSATAVEDVLSAIEEAGGDFAGAFDAPGSEASTALAVQVAARVKSGKRFVATTSRAELDLPEGVLSGAVFALDPVFKNNGALARALYADFVPAALAAGLLKPAPKPLVVGEGLKEVQQGLEALEKRVSGNKVVARIA